MRIAELVAAVALAFVSVPGCSEPKTPDAVVDTDDGGELTCDERARAQSLCQAALRQRCESVEADCEIICDRGELASNAKHPSEAIAVESTVCRDRCRHQRDACVGGAPSRCPSPCPVAAAPVPS
jgi:hypothetical protein